MLSSYVEHLEVFDVMRGGLETCLCFGSTTVPVNMSCMSLPLCSALRFFICKTTFC